MIAIKNNNKGQGMPELIAAVGIIVFALASIISLMMFNVVGQKNTESSLIATNLAREGIEVVRNLRDRDWLVGGSEQAKVYKGNVIVAFNSENNTWTLQYGSNTIGSSLVCKKQGSGIYYQNFGGCPAGEATIFYRLITISSVCSDNTINCDYSLGYDIAYRVKSEVEWTDQKGKHSYSLIDYLYLWR